MPLVTALTRTVVGCLVKAAWSPGLPTRDPKFLNLAAVRVRGLRLQPAQLLHPQRRPGAAQALRPRPPPWAPHDRANRLILFPIQQINIPLGADLPARPEPSGRQAAGVSLVLSDGRGGDPVRHPAGHGLAGSATGGRSFPPCSARNGAGRPTSSSGSGRRLCGNPSTYTAGWVFVSQDARGPSGAGGCSTPSCRSAASRRPCPGARPVSRWSTPSVRT